MGSDFSGGGFQQRFDVSFNDRWQQCFQLGVEKMRLALEGFDLWRAVSFCSVQRSTVLSIRD